MGRWERADDTTARASEVCQLPFQFVSMVMVIDGEALHAMGWCAEPLFNESQRTLENILLSYKRVPGPKASSSTTSGPSEKSEFCRSWKSSSIANRMLTFRVF